MRSGSAPLPARASPSLSTATSATSKSSPVGGRAAASALVRSNCRCPEQSEMQRDAAVLRDSVRLSDGTVERHIHHVGAVSISRSPTRKAEPGRLGFRPAETKAIACSTRNEHNLRRESGWPIVSAAFSAQPGWRVDSWPAEEHHDRHG